MCLRFSIIYHINTVSIDELYVFVKRLVRITIIFLIVNIVETAVTDRAKPQFIWAIFGMILYFCNVFALSYTASHQEDRQIWHVQIPMTTSIVLTLFELANLIYIIVIEKNLWSLFAIVSILLQMSSFYILYKLRSKMIAKENEKLIDSRASAIL